MVKYGMCYGKANKNCKYITNKILKLIYRALFLRLNKIEQ